MPIRLPTATAILLAIGLLADTSTLLTSAGNAVEIVWEGTTHIIEAVRETSARATRVVHAGIDAATMRWQVERIISNAQRLTVAPTDHDLCPQAQAAQQPALSLPWSGEDLLRLRLDDLLRPR